MVFSTQQVYAPPSVNPDWQDYPYCPGGCPCDYLVEEWAKYYDLKGSEWMETKKVELLSAISDGTVRSWIENDPTKANQNVFTYYYVQGETPGHDGSYFSEFPRCGEGTKLVEDQCVPICEEGSYYEDGLCIVMNPEPIVHRDCLIATASYGSELAPQVQMLREIRDNILLNTESGKIFMNGFNTVYYSFSPQVAQLENENPIFKEAVRLFITPMITTLSIMTLIDNNSELQVVLVGMSAIGLIVGMYVVAPVTLIWKVGKRR